MICPQCGTQLRDDAAYCTACGAKQAPPTQQPPQGYQQPNSNTYSDQAYFRGGAPSDGKVEFGQAIKLFFINYAKFSGRASRSEFWWAFLFTSLVGLATGFIPVLGWLVSIGFLVPNLAIAVRRLHDTGKDWYWLFMGLIPFAGPIILIVYFAKESVGDNQWGPGIPGYGIPQSNPYVAQQYAAPQQPQQTYQAPQESTPVDQAPQEPPTDNGQSDQ